MIFDPNKISDLTDKKLIQMFSKYHRSGLASTSNADNNNNNKQVAKKKSKKLIFRVSRSNEDEKSLSCSEEKTSDDRIKEDLNKLLELNNNVINTLKDNFEISFDVDRLNDMMAKYKKEFDCVRNLESLIIEYEEKVNKMKSI